MDTIREINIQDILARLAEIRVSNGYNTDVGANVRRSRKKVDPSELPAVIVIPGTEKVTAKYGQSFCVMSVRIEGIMEFGANDPGVVSEWILADLKKCILAPPDPSGSPDTGWTRSPDYIDGILYAEGGTEEYPDEGQSTIGAFALFDVSYTTNMNDPCGQ